MKNIRAYLNFNGNCREAMTFYKRSLGGKLQLLTIGQSPMGNRMPTKMKDYILHATLTNDNFILMASDMVNDLGLQKGNTISLMLDCISEEQLKECYNNLSAGGEQTHPIDNTFWGALFGDLTDKFGNHWLLHYQKSNSSN